MMSFTGDTVESASRARLLWMRAGHGPPAWAVGFALAVCGYTCCGAGMNLIKLSHVKVTGAPANLSSTRWNRRGSLSQARGLWFAGYAVNAIGACFNLLGLRFAAQSLIAPLSSVALVANLLFATIILGERFCPQSDSVPMILIAIGNIVAVGSANHRPQDALTLQEIKELFFRQQFKTYVLVVIVFSSCLMLLRERLRKQIIRSGGENFAPPSLLARVGVCHTAAAAMLCVNTVFLSKASMLALAAGVSNALQPQFFALILSWLSLVVFWVYTLNRLLRSYDLLFIVPVVEVLWSLFSIVSGGLFFREYVDMSTARKIAFCVGACVNFVGILLLSKRGDKARKLG